ncbi:class I SAM-dependent methyltransferase [Gloeobacter morelensis]|uniref:Class I SAM-dependent methyltransferase n=1 Tax=Gloeobacter morelensis MG652769 TaxID=2781736 RepID=A0ABY3PM43_9CYAN|nr:class I SAM-dependent methyltransferase [Gloeobacter morelensis]UFP94716.1 class I SAM-dependent methyltransferase [Gloeobacter morelensis MG652769]
MNTAATAQACASAQAVQYHYDLGNEFYRLWLDSSMTYSCGLWEADGTLEEAQARKIDHHIREARAAGGGRVLDIGCGWGGTLRSLVGAHGVTRAVGLTLSQTQATWIAAFGHPRIEVRLESWQNHAPTEPYDAIISVGAFEHFARPDITGAQKVQVYREFFERCYGWLPPGGRLSLQTIAYGNVPRQQMHPFFATEIFPESDLPTLAEIAQASERTFEVLALRNDAEDYRLTCQSWLSRLKAHRAQAVELVGEAAVNRYEKYLALFVISFRTRAMHLLRLTLRRNDRLFDQQGGYRMTSDVQSADTGARSAPIPGMRGEGYYDAHSDSQKLALVSAQTLIAGAVRRIPLPTDSRPFTVVDYGCSEGRNSGMAARWVIDALVDREAPVPSICVIFNDLPTNHFNGLFRNLASTGSGLETTDGCPIFVFASGRSFYSQILPSGTASFGLSSTALHWLSRPPVVHFAEHTYSGWARGPVREAFAAQSREDLTAFLFYRAREIRPGGRLVLLMLGRADAGELVGIDGEKISGLMTTELMNQVLIEMVEDGTLDRQEYHNFFYPTYCPSLAEVLAPLQEPGSPLVEQFTVEHAEVQALPCPLYTRYRQSGNLQEYAQAYTAFIRAFSEPLFAQTLFRDREGSLEDYYARIHSRIARSPQAFVYEQVQLQLVLARN